jgi:TPR repeat protein
LCVAIAFFLYFPYNFAFGADPERRVALVIGNSDYKNLPSLTNPANDVKEVANTLRGAGFDVTIGIDVDRLGLEDTVRHFMRSAHNADVGLIYYSGHGFQVAGQNYIVPIDASLETAYDVETQTMPLDLILDYLRQNARVQLIFLDACRNNPFKAKKVWLADTLQAIGSDKGLARIDGNLGSLIAFSTEPGQVALDGTGSLSPYTQSFVRNAVIPNKELREVLTDVRRDVIAATDGRQVPWENSSLVDNFYFLRAPPPPKVEPMQHVSVEPGATESKLLLRPPHDETGAELKVTLDQLPQNGKIVLDGKPLASGAQIPASELSNIAYDVTSATAGSVDLIGYTVADPYGQETRGVVVITVSDDAAAKMEEAKRQNVARSDTATRYLRSLSGDVAATIGVGPIPLKLAAIPSAAQDTQFQVKALPEKGVVRAGTRDLAVGYVISPAEMPLLTYEPQIGTEGRTFGLTIASADAGTTAATVTFKPILDPCDNAAGAPLDLQGVTAGKLPNEIDAPAALSACGKAVDNYPAVARFVYQLGRAQLAAKQTVAGIETIQRAMDKGHIRAAAALSGLYFVGATGQRDESKSKQLAQMGADKGDPYALYALGKDLFYGVGTPADPKTGLTLMLQAADLGHTYAMNELGYIFLNGVNVPADPDRAIRFYEAGVARNDIYSQNNLALAYRFGHGTNQDLAKALELFTKAADGGQPYAPTNLGRMYRDGIGVPKDAKAAVKWLEMGADRGDYWGALDRAHLALTDDAGPRNPATAARYFALAAAVNAPLTGDTTNQAVKELAALPASAKKQAEATISKELTPAEKRAIAKAATPDDQLVALAKAAWEKQHPRYDLF